MKDISKAQKRIEKLQITHDKLANKCATVENKKNAGGYPVRILSDVQRLNKYTEDSCMICDKIVLGIRFGEITLDLQISDMAERSTDRKFAIHVYDDMSQFILSKRTVPKEVYSMVEASCILADQIMAKITPTYRKWDGGGITAWFDKVMVDLSIERNNQPGYARNIFEKLVKSYPGSFP